MVDVEELTTRSRVAPREVRFECERHLADPSTAEHERAKLFLALGWAAFTQADLDAAAAALAEARQLANHDTVEVDLADVLRLEYALLIESGQIDRAIERITPLLENLEAENKARLWSGHGAALHAAGDNHAAIQSYDRGLREAQDSDDRFTELLLLNNRSVSHLELGEFAEASAGLEHVRANSSTSVFEHLYIISTHNIGVLEARLGRVAAAIGYFTEASKLLEDAEDRVSHAHALIDQAQLFLDAGLLDEALHAAERSENVFERLDSARRCADALLVQAQAMGSRGDWLAASELARAAKGRAGTTITPRSLDLAQQLILSGELLSASECGTVEEGRLVEVANADANLAVDVAVALAEQGRPDEAMAILRATTECERSAQALTRLHHSVAAALLGRLEGRHTDAISEVQRGLQIAYESAIALGVSDLRVMTARRVSQLRDCGLDLEADTKDAAVALEVLELARAVDLLPEPDLSPVELSLLTRLRSLAKALFERSSSEETIVSLTRSRNQIERDLRDIRRSRTVSQSGHGDDVARPKGASSDSNLASLAVVHLFIHRGDLNALVQQGPQKVVKISLGDVRPVRKTLAALRLTLAAGAGSPSAPRFELLAQRLSKRLAPLLSVLDGLQSERIVVVPDPKLDHIPWVLISDHPIAIAPSQRTLNLSRQTEMSSRSGVVAVAGPGLEHAAREVQGVAEAYGEAVTLLDQHATSAEVIARMREADVVHFASHGVFRWDNPLYSSLQLGDGPLTFFDLLAQEPPNALVLSSCDVGRAAASSSLGLASLVLARGCGAVVASTGPVNDASAVDLMIEMHRQRAAGLPVATALFAAQAMHTSDDPSLALFAAYGLG